MVNTLCLLLSPLLLLCLKGLKGEEEFLWYNEKNTECIPSCVSLETKVIHKKHKIRNLKQLLGHLRVWDIKFIR